MQYASQNTNNCELMKLLDLKNNASYDNIRNFLNQFCSDEEFDIECIYAEDVNLHAKKVIKDEYYITDIKAVRYGQPILELKNQYRYK